MIQLRVLLIEDSELDAGLILWELKKGGYAITSIRVENEDQLIEALENQWDIIIADYRLPEFSATEALSIVQNSGIDTPFIIVSGAIGEETAVGLMRSGARDYLMKDKLSRLPPVVERELVEVNVRRMQKQAHEALMESEKNLKISQQVAHIGHWVFDLVSGNGIWSDEMYRILGLDQKTFTGNPGKAWRVAIHPDDQVRIYAHTDLNDVQNLQDEMEYRIIRPDGTIRYIWEQVGEPRQDASGRDIQYSGVVHDITERKKMELDLLEKMKESQSRASELEAITFVSSRMRQADSKKEILIIVLQELVKLLRADHATIGFIKEDTLSVEYSIKNGKTIPTNKTHKMGKILQQYIQNGELGFFETISPETMGEIPDWIYDKSPVPSSLIAYPIISESQTIGLIYLDFIVPKKFNQEHRNFVEAVAEMAGNAFNRMSATSDLESMVDLRERELESIYKVTSSASATLDISQALQQALSLTLEAVHTNYGGIFLLKESGSDLDLVAYKDGKEVPHEFFSKPQLKKNLDRVVEQRKALVVSDMVIDSGSQRKKVKRSGYSFIGLPMRAQDRVVGVLIVIHKNSEQMVLQEMTLLSFIADHLALVVEITRLYKKAGRSAVMEERSRLARELHDSVTQSLYSASLYSAGARRFFGLGKYSEVDSYLTQIGDLTQQALKDMRLLVYELRSPELKRIGLIGALQNRLDAVERRVNIEAEIHADGVEELPESIEENLYRIAIESLNNSLKHAQATQISLDFYREHDEVVFAVKDNGIGFQLEKAVHSGGMGLITMRERAERIGAIYKILTLPKKGTTIEIRLKIK